MQAILDAPLHACLQEVRDYLIAEGWVTAMQNFLPKSGIKQPSMLLTSTVTAVPRGTSFKQMQPATLQHSFSYIQLSIACIASILQVARNQHKLCFQTRMFTTLSLDMFWYMA